MKKIFSLFAVMLMALTVSADPVVLPATLDVSNVSFRSEGMPDYVIEEGDYAGTYFDMGAHDSSNDTLLYAEWDVTIQSLKYNLAVDVYNENGWTVQLYLLNQAGDTLKGLRYKGSSGKSGQFAVGSWDLRDLEAGDYKVRARAATAWSKMKLKDVIFEADYKGVQVALPGTLQPAYAELSAGASVTNNAIAFKPGTAPDEYATWNVNFAEAGDYSVTIDYTASNGHTYGVALLATDGITQIGAVAEAQAWDTGVKKLGFITVPAVGNYIVKLTNATQWSEAVLNSITFDAPNTLYLAPGANGPWYYEGNKEKFAVYAYESGLPEYWSDYMTLAENETDIWTVKVPAAYTNVIFVRFGSASTTPSWTDNMWNQTEDLTIAGENDLYTITAQGEGKATGAWSKYAPAKFYISGIGGWGAKQVRSNADSYTFENLAANSYSFKVLPTGSWSYNKGYNDLSVKPGGISTDKDGNVCFTLAEAGDVTITYIEDETFTIEGNWTMPTVQIGGSWTTAETWGEDLTNFVPAADKVTASATLNLTKNYYEFKMVIDGAWISKNGTDGLYTLNREWPSVSGLETEKSNLVIKPDVAGDYTFTWEYATGILTVTFPELPDPTFYIAGDFTIEGDYTWVMKPLVEDEGIWSAIFTINTTNHQEFKVVKRQGLVDTWFGQTGDASMTPDNNSWVMDGYNNVGLTPNKAGDYTFKYDEEKNELTVIFPGGTTTIDNAEVSDKAVKKLVNGQLIIEKNGKTYTVTGLQIR